MAAGRSERIVSGRNVSDRRGASNRDRGVNAQVKAENKPNRSGTTQNRAVTKPGRAANAQIKRASKSNPAVNARSKTAIKPNHAAKAAHNEVGEVAEDVAIYETIKVKAIVGVTVFVVARRIVIAGETGNAGMNLNGNLDPRRKCRKHRPNRRRSQSRLQLACGTRFLDRRPSRRQSLSTSRSMSPARRRTCETSHAPQAAAFLMRMPTIRCRCSTRPKRRIDLGKPRNRRKLPMKMLVPIGRAVDPAGAAGGVVADESRMTVYPRVARRGGVLKSRV